ncbi:hypothetical protein OAM69_03885 [bacterium]|nr:hypothetical protein [bacterium]
MSFKPLQSTIGSLIGALLSAIPGVLYACEAPQNTASSIPGIYKESALTAGVPYKLLYAVAIAESNNPNEAAFEPWPWTLNVNGKGMYFATKAEAVVTLTRELGKGTRNIDICAGQINYRYNHHLIPDINKALDLKPCLAAATHVLNRELRYCKLKLRKRDWWCAVERYHSPGKSVNQRQRAIKYAARVKSIYTLLC